MTDSEAQVPGERMHSNALDSPLEEENVALEGKNAELGSFVQADEAALTRAGVRNEANWRRCGWTRRKAIFAKAVY